VISYFMMVPFVGREAAVAELRVATDAEKTAVPCAPLDRPPTER
jgi:hypothetical protein